MIRTVAFKGYKFFENREDVIVIRRIESEQMIKVALPFHEDTPNFDLTMAEAMDLRNALNDLIGPVLTLPAPATELFPKTQVSVSDQSSFSALFDRFPSDSESDIQARKALAFAAGVLGLPLGGFKS